MGSQLFCWALAALACGLGNPAEARMYIQKVLQLSDPDVIPATVIWMVPSVTYTLVTTKPEQAVELLAWVFAYPNTALHWVRQWPLFDRLQSQLQATMGVDSYEMYWKKGKALTFDGIKTYLQQEFGAATDASAEVSHQQLLTAREHEILGLLAAGMTNPQIAAQLVIGAGTVKTHTLSIYRKLEVANRTQAIVRAQEVGLLHA
jgi:ATP/maltotriose-dependent transcriptional regulator MalT